MLFNYNYIKQFKDRDISAENREENIRTNIFTLYTLFVHANAAIYVCSLWVVWMLVPPIYRHSKW